MKQTNLQLQFGFGFLLATGLAVLLAVSSAVWAQAGGDSGMENGLVSQTAVSKDETPSISQATTAINSGITYQGTLDNGGSPVNGTYNFRFRLYDALNGGTQVGEDPINNVAVTDGRFTVQLDFGANAYAAEAVWLEIAVDDGGYQTLTPRQPLTAAPLALNLPNVYTNPTTGQVGIGTDDPLNQFTKLTVNSPTTDSYGGMYVTTSGANGQPFYGYSVDGLGADAWHEFNGATGEWVLHVGDNSSPEIRVDTSGNISQPLSGAGMVKAAVYANCNSVNSSIERSFNNVNETAVTVSNGASAGRCTIDFGFDVSDRFWSATAVHYGIARVLTCDNDLANTQLACLRTDANGSGVNGYIIVLIY